jgi:hypothetical protein
LALALPPRRLFWVDRFAELRFAALFDDRLAALAAVPRDRGLPPRSSVSPVGELLRRARVLRADPRGDDFLLPAERVVARFPLARFAPVLFAFVRRAIRTSGVRHVQNRGLI